MSVSTADCTAPTPPVWERYSEIRRFSEILAVSLSPEDCSIQSMPDASPTRWHLAHTTWFFETFLLKSTPDYQPTHPQFEYLFNSYYNTVGKQFPRAQRGMLSRPGLGEVLDYREEIDEAMQNLFAEEELGEDIRAIIEVGLNHEQQHQELLLTDIKHAFSLNPLLPVYRPGNDGAAATKRQASWLPGPEGVQFVGHEGSRFAFDNERPQHETLLHPFEISSECVTNADFLEFIQNGGYERPEFWLSAGWNAVEENGWSSPLYWTQREGQWNLFTLGGLQPLVMDQPVCHVSYFEADAFARWAGCRLPTESEWETAVQSRLHQSDHGSSGHWSDCLLREGRTLHPQASKADDGVMDFGNALGNVWEWTSSQYSAYPGYQTTDGALGEYNGKFMCNQFVLRGGSCATPSGHIRTSYRNFFPPETRWQFSGIRLAR